MSTPTNVDLKVHVNGNAVATYTHEGRTYVEAREGTEYALHLNNRNPFRVKVVLSVDGVNVVSGDPASGTQEETGYILGAYETYTVKGYRLDDNAVAAFKFTKAEGGYAKAEKGMSGTTGVIGMRVWKEKVAPPPPTTIVKEVHHHHDHWYDPYPWKPYYPWPNPVWIYSNSTTYRGGASDFTLCGEGAQAQYMACGMGSSAGSNEIRAQAFNCASQLDASSIQGCLETNPFDAGSTFGAKVESAVNRVAFEVECLLGSVEIYYAFRAGLQALGVDLTKAAKVAFPQAFAGYCKPPSGYKG